jgi:hypothetical protein
VWPPHPAGVFVVFHLLTHGINMAPLKKLHLTAPGAVLDRAARKHRLSLSLDPSPRQFLSLSMGGRGKIGVVIRPRGEHRELAPIELLAQVKSLTLKLEGCVLADSTRLNDLDFLVNDDKAEVEIELMADPQGELFADEDADTETE